MIRQFLSEQRGQSTVEFALVSIPLFLLVIGLFDLGRATFHYHMISNAAREGARAGVTSASAQQICQIAAQKVFAPNVPSTPACVQVSGIWQYSGAGLEVKVLDRGAAPTV